ncbi:DEAD-domain-containing protein [Basidiobolus meristosporus CBS 931.73]|uniref:ATP-dependent RNA helicase n=1 Tax=Basidiobolus meristosporus CBS 931.73 TaxID=1314790 RepID=A0A1Y1YIE0_9FUNG|nr:DEAD-domain-containing protein [Basidiobolus meristosporus CBS 931.73]|eukprot:ORX97486.1 DEAD-domain-containing protein [Basidiobolus meristosporus CBS 931.73]
MEAFPVFNEEVNPDKTKDKKLGLPQWLANPDIISPETTRPVDDPKLNLSSQILSRCKDNSIEEFFAVQTAVLPALLASKSSSLNYTFSGDLCVSAPTGSGKTLAYVIPIVETLSTRVVTRLRALIILPTRDLVVQVKDTFDAFCKGTNLKIGVITGQTSFAQEQSQIVGGGSQVLQGGASNVDILIATPGRLIDHLTSTPNFTLQHLRYLVIDEADRLLNQSYQDWLSNVLQAAGKATTKRPEDPITMDSEGIPVHDAISGRVQEGFCDLFEPQATRVQKLLFSATLTRNPGKIASLHLVNPRYIAVQRTANDNDEDAEGSEGRYTTPSTLKEFMIPCSPSEKPMIVLHLLYHLKVNSALCFTKSIEAANRLYKLIEVFDGFFKEANPEYESTIMAAEYSGDLPQSERTSILKKFKKGEIRLLICSDLIARGIDLDSVEAVISYDAPMYIKKYIHRVGRTARAGREGVAYTIVEEQEMRYFKSMLQKAQHYSVVKKMNVKEKTLEPLMPNYEKTLEVLKSIFNASTRHQSRDSKPAKRSAEQDVQGTPSKPKVSHDSKSSTEEDDLLLELRKQLEARI